MEGDSRQQENIETDLSDLVHDAGSILQSSWIRRSPVLANCLNWESMERQYCFVLCGGTILWAIHLATLFI
jgi:hypothetical protein